jgi:hypothetical protein
MRAMGIDATAPPQLLPAGLADAWVMPQDLSCPGCRYNLRMLRTPRCPECGLVFRWQALLCIHCPRCGHDLSKVHAAACPQCELPLDWTKLLETASPRAARVYEYTRKPIRRFLHTCVAALWPGKFWRDMRIEDIPVVSRLRRFRQAAVAMCIAGIGLPTVWLVSQVPAWNRYTLDWLAPGELSLPFVVALLLPVVTMLLLPQFTPTLTRFEIRRDQLLRVLAYGCTGVFWIGALFALGFTVQAVANVFFPVRIALPIYVGSAPRLQYDPRGTIHLLLQFEQYYQSAPTRWFNLSLFALLGLIAFIWWWLFLYIGLRRYLRLDRRNATALFLSTQVIALLAMACVLFLLPGVNSKLAVVIARMFGDV